MDSARTDDVPTRYADFARHEIRGRTAVFKAWSEGVAADPEVCARIEELPPLKRQPVLVFAAARHAGIPATTDYQAFRTALLERWPEVAGIARTHSTQTNEPLRSAALAPFFSLVPGPIGLVEVGASAGLLLYPDRFPLSYTVDGLAEPVLVPPFGPGPTGPVLECELRGGIPAPRQRLEIAHRGGVDLNPLDPTDDEDRAWLRTLIWPGQEDERLPRLDAALELARADPPQLLAGDAVERLAEAVAAVPAGVTPVVFHYAVLAYLEPEHRAEFVQMVRSLDCVWISVEGMPILPEVEAQLPKELRANRGLFVVSVGGQAMATAHGHGQWVRALDFSG